MRLLENVLVYGNDENRLRLVQENLERDSVEYFLQRITGAIYKEPKIRHGILPARLIWKFAKIRKMQNLPWNKIAKSFVQARE